jgi:bifunctional pyridoxal-dependent enzyme with beta-cystathionase and maltose regulon repressor activities
MYGEQGRNWMRLAIGVPDDRLDEALERLKRVQW